MSTITLPQFPGCSAVTKPVRGTPMTEFAFDPKVKPADKAAFAQQVFERLTKQALEAAKRWQ